MKLRAMLVHGLLVMSALLLILQPASASEWHSIAIGARPLNITANRDAIWVCGADELVANSTDGGKTWNVQHLVKGGAVLLAIGAAGERFVSRWPPSHRE